MAECNKPLGTYAPILRWNPKPWLYVFLPRESTIGATKCPFRHRVNPYKPSSKAFAYLNESPVYTHIYIYLFIYSSSHSIDTIIHPIPRVYYPGKLFITSQRTHTTSTRLSKTFPRNQNLLGLGVRADRHLRASAGDLGGIEGRAAVVGEFDTGGLRRGC